jgi:hypothetical protein
MCGNFGIVIVGQPVTSGTTTQLDNVVAPLEVPELDESLHRSMTEVRRTRGVNVAADAGTKISNHFVNRKAEAGVSTDLDLKYLSILPPARILQDQTARTEMRGGQAGGISVMDYRSDQSGKNLYDLKPICTR